MTDYLMTAEHARWQVLWVVKQKGKPPRIVEVDFENDLLSAQALWLKAKQAGKPMTTLRCCNVAFPPPEKYRQHYEKHREPTGRYKVVTRAGKRYKKPLYRTSEVLVTPLEGLNRRGIWWCPYCREFRKFQHWDGYTSEPMYVGSFIPDPGEYCPMCGVNQRDWYVKKWNPQAVIIQFQIEAPKRTRRAAPKPRRRRRK